MCRRVFPRCALYNGEKKIGVSNGTNKIIPRPNPWSCHRHWLCWNYERVRLHRQQAAKTCGWTWRVVEAGGLEHWLNPMIIAGTYPPISIDLGKDEPGMTLQLRWDPFRKLLSYRQKKTRAKRVFFRWKHHDFAKMSAAPTYRSFCQSPLALWPCLSPKLITFPVTTHFPGSDAFCGCRWYNPSVNCRWHSYATGGDKLPCP